MKKSVIFKLVVCLSFALELIKPITVQAYSIYIDASGTRPTISSDNPFFFPEGVLTLAGPTTITPIGPYAWDINFKVAGSDYASFGGSNRGLELTDPVTGKIINSFGFNYWSRDASLFFNTDIVTFDAYLFTTDPSGNLSGRTPRIYNAQVATAIYDGSFQLAMSDMATAYSTFDVYLKGGVIENVFTAPAPEPSTILLLGLGFAGLAGFRKKY